MSWRLKSTCEQGCLPYESSMGESVSCLFQLPEAACSGAWAPSCNDTTQPLLASFSLWL